MILQPCDWNEAPFGKLQGFPKDAKPITKWSNREEGFTDVALGIRKVVAELRASGSEPVAVRVVSSEAHVLPAIWNVPQRDRSFTGREELLNRLHRSLASGRAAALTQAIVGLGGVGKTRTAVEYCYRYAREYRLVWWMASEEPGRLAADYAAMAQKLKLPEKDHRYQGFVVRAVRDALSRSGGWLLVFDNARTSDEIEAYLPAGNGHVIVTSRNPAFRKIAEVLPVEVMTAPEAIEFLMKHAQGDTNEAEALATELGRLPLALAQAGAYIDKHGSTFGRYLEMFRAHQKEVLTRGAKPDDVTVATTWELAFAEVERKSEVAAQLMHLCAFLAPDDIWQGLLKDGVKFLPTPLAVAVGDDFRWDEAVAALRRYSLLDVQRKTFSVHRLVQAIVRERLEAAGKKEWAAAAVQVVNATFLYELNDIKTWGPCARLLPHAQLSVEHAEGLRVGLEPSGRLLEQVGLYLLGRAKFASAKSVLERTLKINEAAYGPHHPKVAEVVSNLANVLKLQGDREGARAQYERAQAHYERAVKNDEAAHGPDHPKVARDASNLGTVLKEQGDLAGARMQFERALKIDEAVYGLDHPDVAKDVIDLGLVLQRQGNLAGARMQFERALKIDEAAYGPDHPDVARDVNYLGDVLLEQADLAAARAHYERALKIDEAAYGPDHPTVAD